MFPNNKTNQRTIPKSIFLKTLLPNGDWDTKFFTEMFLVSHLFCHDNFIKICLKDFLWFHNLTNISWWSHDRRRIRYFLLPNLSESHLVLWLSTFNAYQKAIYCICYTVNITYKCLFNFFRACQHLCLCVSILVAYNIRSRRMVIFV